MGRGGIWDLSIPLGGGSEGQSLDVLRGFRAPVEGLGQFILEPDGIHSDLTPLGFGGCEQMWGQGQLLEPPVHHLRQNFIADRHPLAAVRVLAPPADPAMAAGAPDQLGPAQAAHRFALNGPDFSGQRGICISDRPLALGGGEVLIGHQPGIALSAGVFGVFQDALDHVFVPLSRVLVVADALMGHLLRNSEEGGPGLILAEDVLYRVRFLGLGEKPEDLRPFDLDLYLYGITKGLEDDTDRSQ